MEQRRKALEKVSWEEMMKKLRGLFSQLSRRALPLGPELHKYTRNGFYTEGEMKCEQPEFTFKSSRSALI